MAYNQYIAHKAGRMRENVESNLAKYCDTYRLTDTYLGEMTGLNRRTIANLLKNPLSMKLDYLKKLADGLGVDIYWLLDICLDIEDFDSPRSHKPSDFELE